MPKLFQSIHSAHAQRPSAAVGGWEEAMRDLALACAGSLGGDEPERLRELARLVAQAPERMRAAGVSLPDPVRLEALIAAGAADAAALSFFHGPSGYLLSRSAAGQHVASVMLSGGDEEVTVGGDSLVLSLVGAVALALAEAAPAHVAAPVRAGDRRLN